MADKSKPPPPTDVSPGSILPPGDHYEFSEFGVKHTTIRTYAPTVTVSAYESTASAFSAPKQQAEVLALEPKIRELPEMLAVAIGHGAEKAGPHLGNPSLPEETLKPLVAYDLVLRRAKRDRWRWIIGTCIVGPLLVVLGVVLKALFF